VTHLARAFNKREAQQEVLALCIGILVDHQRADLDEDCAEEGGSADDEAAGCVRLRPSV
jgi:hypothetical protein